MKVAVIIAVVIYELIVILGVASFLRKREAKLLEQEGGFALGGRSMGIATLAPTIALTVLGAAHITGVFEMTYGMGMIAIWFSMAHIIMIVVACYGTGLWVRRLGVTTVPEAIVGMYGPIIGLMVTCTMAGQVFGVLTLECQGLGIVVHALTGWPIAQGIILGGAIGIMYVIFAGMKEVGAVNMINAVVMYIGLIVATAVVCMKLGGNFNGVVETLQNDPENGDGHMLSVFGNSQLFISFAIGQIIAVTFCQSISQMLMQTMMSAKNEKMIRRSVWIAAPVNGLFGVFAVCLGLAARALPEYSAGKDGATAAKTAAMDMIVDMLPMWISALLLAALLAAILSTFAMTSLTPATIWVNDIYKKLFNPNADVKKLNNMTRIAIVIIAIYAIILSTALPTILDAIGWVFSWVIPVFWIVVFGLFWKRNSKVAGTTLIVAWILNILWSFTPAQAALASAIGVALPNAYITLIASLIILIVGNIACKGEPAYSKTVAFKEV